MAGGRPNQLIQNFNQIIEGQAEYINIPLIATSVDTHVFIATRPMKVTAISYIPRVVGSNGSAVSAMLTKTTGVEAPASGNDLQVAVFDLKATVETVQNATVTTTTADLVLAAGDRISLDVTGTLTAVLGVITVELHPLKKTTDTPA